MLSRSVRNPLVISVSTGIVLLSASAPGSAGTTPEPSGSPTPTPTRALLSLDVIDPPDTQARAGSTIRMRVQLKVLSGQDRTSANQVMINPMSAPGGLASCAVTCSLETLEKGTVEDLTIVIHAPSRKRASKVVVSVRAYASNADSVTTSSYAIHVFAKSKPPSKPSSKPPQANTPKPSGTSAKPSHGGSSGGSNGSGGHSGGSPNNAPLPMGRMNPAGGSNTGAGATPQTAPNNPVLPSVGQQTPSTAPNSVMQNAGSSMHAAGADADELSFEKLASTQIAWLAALLVAFSLLLTQVRLGRSSARPVRGKGAHRKPPRGKHPS